MDNSEFFQTDRATRETFTEKALAAFREMAVKHAWRVESRSYRLGDARMPSAYFDACQKEFRRLTGQDVRS